MISGNAKSRLRAAFLLGRTMATNRTHTVILSPRQEEVYLLIVVEGLDTGRIAEKMGISYTTVKNLKRHVMDKKGVDSSLELAVQYYRQGIPRMLGKGAKR